MPDPTYTVTFRAGVVNLVYEDLSRDQVGAAVREALDVQLYQREGAEFTVTSVQNRAPVVREADQPHDFESSRGAAEGGHRSPCAVCGYARSAPIHAPLPAFSAIMNEMLR